jgi:V8-like Glu-specific endopeptidase
MTARKRALLIVPILFASISRGEASEPPKEEDFVDDRNHKWIYLGEAETTTEMEPESEASSQFDLVWDREELARSMRLTMNDRGFVYVMEEDPYDLAEEVLEKINLGFEPVSEPSQAAESVESVEPTHIFGSESRRLVRANTVYPFSPHINFNSGCSATLVAPGVGWTAGHCVFNANTRRWVAFSARPGADSQDATQFPFGSIQSTCIRMFVPQQRTQGDNDVAFDWALLDFTNCPAPASSVPRPWTAGRPGESTGFFGQWAAHDGHLNSSSVAFYVYGYPSAECPPGGCQWPSIFGHGSRWKGTKSRTELKYRVDVTGGQSGSAVYRFDGWGNRYVIGIHKGGSWDLFHGGEHNRGRRMSPELVFISGLIPRILGAPVDAIPTLSWRWTGNGAWD